jgi:hypothetical protein
VSPPEVWVDGVGRGRSASFTASTTDNQFYRNDGPIQHGNFPQYGYTPNSEVQVSVEPALSESLGTGMSWGAESLGGGNTNPAHPGQLVPGWTYPSSESSSDVSQERPPLSPSLLTVPPVGLQRRPACSSRVRSRSASDLTSLFPPGQDPGRGRGQHRTTLSIPNSRSVSNGSRVSSRDVSPHSLVCFSDVQTPASFSPSSSSSSAFEDAELGGNGVGRRRTFTANRGPDEFLAPGPALSRASSVPSKGRRSKVPSSRAGQGVFKAVKTEASTMAFLSPEGSDGSQQEFRVAQPAVAPFKHEVASKKIRMASDKRRINAAIFKCTYPDCSSTFTARHNLTSTSLSSLLILSSNYLPLQIISIRTRKYVPTPACAEMRSRLRACSTVTRSAAASRRSQWTRCTPYNIYSTSTPFSFLDRALTTISQIEQYEH